jgi:creatinine amidohydrolase/Fe(II)-dependent formamide hydrolase-like protein
MKPFALALCLAAISSAQISSNPGKVPDFGMMTWPEVKAAQAAGKVTALVFNGGTEQRGPQNVNGGHTLMAQAQVIAIAEKLGNAIAAPVMPFSVNEASADLPGTIGLTAEQFQSINERVAEQLLKSGFKNVVLMGDHGGGQQQLAEVAKTLTAKYASEGKKVVFCDQVYATANADFDKYLTAHNLPISSHAGIPDTSEMLYLGGDKGWVRKDLIKDALGDPMPPPGAGRGRGGRGRGQADPNAPPRKNNGIQGDGRASTVELGKMVFDMKVDYAVKQIHELLGN